MEQALLERVIREGVTLGSPQVILSKAKFADIAETWSSVQEARTRGSSIERVALSMPWGERAAYALIQAFIDTYGWNEMHFTLQGKTGVFEDWLEHRETLLQFIRLIGLPQEDERRKGLLSYYIREGCTLEELHELKLGRNLVLLAPPERWAVTSSLAYLVEQVGAGFTLWLNISPETSTLRETVRLNMGSDFAGIITHDLTRQ